MLLLSPESEPMRRRLGRHSLLGRQHTGLCGAALLLQPLLVRGLLKLHVPLPRLLRRLRVRHQPRQLLVEPRLRGLLRRGVSCMHRLLVAPAALTSQLELLLSRRALLLRALPVALDLGVGHAPLGRKLRRRAVQKARPGSNG